MKLSLAFLSIAAAVAAQSIGDAVPACAAPCLTSAITSTTSCSITEAACQCTIDNFRTVYTAALSCVLDGCGADVALNQVLPAAEKFCLDTVGVSVSPPSNGAQQNAPPAPAFTMAPGLKQAAYTAPAGSIQPSIPNTVVTPTTVASAIPNPPVPTKSRAAATGAASSMAVGSFFAFGAAFAALAI